MMSLSDPESYEIFVDPRNERFEGVIITHGPKICAGQVCAIHNPTHHMKDWPIRFGIGDGFPLYRVCEHGVEHTDPDSRRFLARRGIFPRPHHCPCKCCIEPEDTC